MGIFDFFKKNKVKTFEITNDDFKKLDDKELFLDKDKNPFSGLMIINKTDDNGMIECNYKNGKQDGVFIEYDKEVSCFISLFEVPLHPQPHRRVPPVLLDSWLLFLVIVYLISLALKDRNIDINSFICSSK